MLAFHVGQPGQHLGVGGIRCGRLGYVGQLGVLIEQGQAGADGVPADLLHGRDIADQPADELVEVPEFAPRPDTGVGGAERR